MGKVWISLTLALLASACGDPVDAPTAPSAPADAPPDPIPASPQPQAKAPFREMLARGNEPFWAVAVKADTLKLQRPDHADVETPNPGPVDTAGAQVWTTSAFRLSIRPGQCSDGMSDMRYSYEAEVAVGAEIMKGCAFYTDDPPAQPQ